MYRFTNLNIEDGLSYSAINCIIEDNLGVKWFGTQNGLDKFDSINFKHFKYNSESDETIPGNGIADLLLDGDLIWISTNAGFCSYNYITETLKRHPIEIKSEEVEKSNYTRAITQDKADSDILWLGSYNGLLKFNKNSKSFCRYLIVSQGDVSKNNITAIYDESLRYLWVGSYGGGIYKFDKITGEFYLIPNTQSLMILTIKSLSTYGLIVGTENNGIYKLDTSKDTVEEINWINSKEIKHNSIRCILEDSQNNLWLGSQNKGLFIFERENKELINLTYDRFNTDGLSNNYIRSLFVDTRGIVWIGTLSGGVCFFDPKKFRFRHVRSIPNKEDSILSNIVRGFVEDNEGHLWVATESGGVTKYNRESGSYKHFVYEADNDNTINSDLIRGVYKDNHNTVWVFTFSGICYYNTRTDSFIRYKLPNFVDLDIDLKSIRFIFNDSKDNYWLGSEFGLIYINHQQKHFEHYHVAGKNDKKIASNMVRFIFEENCGRILLVTLDGNSIIDRRNKETQNFKRTKASVKSCYDCFIFSMYEDNEYIWLGTFDGLFRKNKVTNEVKRYDENDGLANKVIYGILADDKERIWVSTNNGLSFLNVKEETFVNFDVSDGLQSTEFNNSAYMKTRDGEMFFGGINGYNHFYPELIEKDTSKVKLVFTEFLVSNEVLEKPNLIAKESLLHIPYYTNHFKISFCAIEYSHPKKIQYKCKLEGYDKEWIDLKYIRNKTYRNISPGEYTFKVKSTNRDKIFVDNTILITVRVEQPPWQQSLNPVSGKLEENEVLKEYLKEMERSNKELQKLNENLLNHNRELLSSVYKDALTGIFNRAGYMKYLETYIQNGNYPIGLFVIDVDSLKLINDNLGHERGDKLLICIGRILTDYEYSDGSIVSRIGGDEFAILIPNCSLEIIKEVENWLSIIRKKHYDINSEEFFCLSYGYSTTLDTEVNELFSKADSEMYNYKRENGLIARKRTLDYIATQNI